MTRCLESSQAPVHLYLKATLVFKKMVAEVTWLISPADQGPLTAKISPNTASYFPAMNMEGAFSSRPVHFLPHPDKINANH